MNRWPRDNQADLIAFYGTPGTSALEAQLVDVVPPFRMTYEGKPIKSIKFHKKAAPALLAALTEVWDHYGKDQSKIDALGVSRYDGAYNPRFIRGSSWKWSNHGYGAAIDINAKDNGFNTGHGNMPQPVVDAFKRQGARWGGNYHGRTDPMHFEFCDNGETVAPAAPPPPASAGFLEAFRLVLVHEGGYTNDAADPGGPTNWGITIGDARSYWKKDATAADVRAMPLEVAQKIYRERYWTPMRCDDLPDGVAYCAFDYGVNSGIYRSAKVLQHIVGVPVDGMIGPVTIAATAKADQAKLINDICDERMAYLRGLGTWSTFGKGWTARVKQVRTSSLAMAKAVS